MDNIVCRICLKDDSMCEDIYVKTKHKKLSYSAMMIALFSLPVSHGDGLPSKLCKKCRIKLISAYNLRLLAEKSYNTLKNLVEKCDTDDKINEEYFKSDEKILDAAFDNDRSINQNVQLNEFEKVEIKNEIDSEVFGDSIIKQEYLEVVFDVSGSNKDEGVDDHLEDDRSLGYEDEDDTPLNLLNCNSTNIYEKEKKKLRKKTDSIKDGNPKRSTRRKKDRVKKIGSGKASKVKSGVCEVCGIFARNVTEHAKTHLKDKLKFPCAECSKVFSSMSGRRKHMNYKHLGKTFYCELCDKTVVYKNSHMVACHTEKAYKCEVCNRSFPTEALHRNHVSSHYKEIEPSYCDVCQKMFKTKLECRSHMRRVHDKERPHLCHLCSKKFFTAYLLKQHIRSHKQERPFKCTECDKAFVTSSCLLIHKRRHAGLKNWSCKLCSKQFVAPGPLKTHMLSHTKEKKHPCRYCNVMFGRTDHRNRHERTAHLNKLETQLHKKNITDSIPDVQT